MTAAAEPVLADRAPKPGVRLTASTITDDQLDALYAELAGARATIDHMTKAMSWISGHDRQGLDHLEEAQQEARDRDAAEAAIERVCDVAERWERYGSADLKRYAAILRAALDGPSEPRTAPTAALVPPVGLRDAQSPTGGPR